MMIVEQALKTAGLTLPSTLIQNAIVCIDSHTAGEPTRLAIRGVPEIPGRDIVEKTGFFRDNLDYLRSTLTGEPRGHAPMHAAILTPSKSSGVDFGLILMSALGYLDMCGHALVGAVACAVELRLVKAEEPLTRLTIETGAGNINVIAGVSGGRVQSVTFRNQPSFVYRADLVVEVDTLGALTVDIAYGGLWYVIVERNQLGLEIELGNLVELRRISSLILEEVNRNISVRHPEAGESEKVSQLLFTGPPANPRANGMNLVTSKELGFDRSPCGTGSCAKMSLLFDRGDITLGEEYIHESVIGTLFHGRLVEKTQVGSVNAVIPEITASAHVTGLNYILIDPHDPLRHGFYLCV